MKKEDVKVDFDSETRTIKVSGERKHEESQEGEKEGRRWYRSERSFGSFQRQHST
eukprot:GABW01000190.1.p2 GENE.GABW01000190.1~~GABW01000190.1.p2  ORF type:complete len:55 (-),score=13.19 GABW01000190.1:3-167(-)